MPKTADEVKAARSRVSFPGIDFPEFAGLFKAANSRSRRQSVEEDLIVVAESAAAG